MRSAVALLAVSLVACGALLGGDEDDSGGSSSGSSGRTGDASADDGSNADASGGSDARVDGDVALGCSVPAGPIGTCAVSAGGCQTQTLIGARTNQYDERAYGITTTPAEIVWIAQSPTESATPTNTWGAGTVFVVSKGAPSTLPRKLADNQYRATEIVLDGRTAYWVAATANAPDARISMVLRSVSLDCATPCTPNDVSAPFDAQDSVVRLVHPSTKTFVFVDAAGTSYVATQTAPTAFTVTANPVAPLSPPPSLAVIPPKAWFGSATSDTLLSYDVDTQQVSILPTGINPQALVSTCDGFYVASMPPAGGDPHLYRVELSGLTSDALTAISDPSDLGVDATFVYVASVTGSGLTRIARQSATLSADVLSAKPIARIAVTDEGIYWGDNQYGGLYLTKKN